MGGFKKVSGGLGGIEVKREQEGEIEGDVDREGVELTKWRQAQRR